MAWTATPKEIKKNEDGTGLNIKVEVTDGLYTEVLTRPLNRPKTADEIDATCKNWIGEVKLRKEAIDKINAMWTEVQAKIDKPVPETAQVIEE